MSHKQAKQIRKELRNQGVDPKQVDYNLIKHTKKIGDVVFYTFQNVLDNCGRYTYQTRKRKLNAFTV